MGIPGHLTCLLRNLYAGQEATVRTEHGKKQTSPKLGKEYVKAIYCHINNLRYADDTTLMAERREELKSLLMKVKEESEKLGFKAQHSENEDHGIWHLPSLHGK